MSDADDDKDDSTTVPGAIARMTASEQAYRIESMTLLLRMDRAITRMQERVKNMDERQDEHAQDDKDTFAAIDKRFERLEQREVAVTSNVARRMEKNDDFRKEFRARWDTISKVALIAVALISAAWAMFEHYSPAQPAQPPAAYRR